LPHYEKALILIEAIGDLEGTARAYANVGATLDELHRKKEALPYLEKGLELARQSKNASLIGPALVNLGNWCIEGNNKLSKGERYYQESIPYLEKTDSAIISNAFNGIGNIKFQQKKYSEAVDWLKKGLRTAEEFNTLKSQQYALRILKLLAEETGQMKMAYEYSEKYHLIKDSLVNLQSLATINELNIEYESEKKEKENLQLQNELTQSELEATRQKALRNQLLGIASFILLLGLGGFLWFRYRQRIRIKEQEMELEQERARQEQRRKEAEKLRELDAMKTRFFTNISHEFRTPLTLILGQNERLQASVEDESLKPRFQMVDRNGHRLLDLVNQVLDVAKLEAGGMTLEFSTLDAIPYLKHLLYSFESMAEEKGVRLKFSSGLDKLNTAFDTHRIERVFFNLLSNAFKFTPSGGQVTMSAEKVAQTLVVKIEDTGIGIKAEQVPYLFDRFYQADSSDNLAQPGTGIGLSLVKELVELHGGKVSATSELNQGTVFTVELPIPDDLSQFESSSDIVETTLNPEALPRKNISANMEHVTSEESALAEVLLIEDNPDVRSYVRDQLIEFGYKTVEAVDGIDGLEKAKAHVPDLIISDIMMPRLDGYGVAKGLKEDERTSHIPVILLTSKASDESKVAGFERGIDDYLLKPFNSVELKARVANLIEQRKRLRQRFSSATIIRPNEVSAVPMDQIFLKKVLETIEANLTNEQFGVDTLSEEVGMSSTHLNRKLRALVDQTAGKLIRSMRLQRAADLLRQQAATISEVAYDMGFQYAFALYAEF
jgi:signal transduction histidine kinase/DNA-binding response OmpR family regulator